MALENLKRLLIPRKNSTKQRDLDTNWRTIERWANALQTGGGGGYASLTGPGQTVTPGALTQAGDFEVDGALTANGDFNQSGTSMSMSDTGTMTFSSGFNATFTVVNTTSTLTITCGSGGTQTTAVMGNGTFHVTSPDMFFNADGAVFRINGGSGESFRITGSGSPTFVDVANAADALRFFHTGGGSTINTVTGSRGANAALSSLLTALAAYGLIVNSTTP